MLHCNARASLILNYSNTKLVIGPFRLMEKIEFGSKESKSMESGTVLQLCGNDICEKSLICASFPLKSLVSATLAHALELMSILTGLSQN